MGAVPAPLVAVAMAVRGQPLPARMRAISDEMLGHPHHDDPLGEGEGHDADPLVRYDMYDCLTFVEEVLSLALAGDPEHAAEVRLDLRYDDTEAEYEERRHFMELQWLPANVARGWLRPTTGEYGTVQQLHRTVEPSVWRNWAGTSGFALEVEELPVGEMRLDILPLEAAIEAVPSLRPGSILMVVREPRAYKPIWITHLGLVFEGEEGRRTLRHASRMRQSRRVRDNDLVRYLELLRTYKNWPVAGIAIFEPVDFGPRATAAAPSGG